MTFDEIAEEITSTRFTKSPNDLDDLLLQELPNEYYCYWRFMWRKLFGWQKTEDNFSLRTIAKAAHIPVKAVSRAAWFFHMINLVRYTPGTKNKVNSHFLLFPEGIIPLEDLKRVLETLKPVLAKEKQLRAADKDFRYTVNDFNLELQRAWEARGGQVARPAVM